MTSERKVTHQELPEQVEADLNDETRVALALYLKVYSEGKVTKDGIIVPELNIYKLSQQAEVPGRMVSKTFERLRGKGFLSNLPDRKSTRLNSSHSSISYAVFCLKK